jgi:hypothetical protein
MNLGTEFNRGPPSARGRDQSDPQILREKNAGIVGKNSAVRNGNG